MYVCMYICMYVCMYVCMNVYMYVVGSKVSGLTYKSRAKRKILWGIYSAIYGEVKCISWKVCWNKGRLCWKIAKLFYFCHFKKLVRPETFGPYYICMYVCMYICMYVCMYVRMYVYIYIYLWRSDKDIRFN